MLFIDTLASGGAQRQMVTLACGLKDAGYGLRLVTYRAENQLEPYLIQHGVTWDVVPKRAKFDPLFLWNLFWFFRRHKPDVMICYLRTPNLWGRLIGKLAGIPAVVTSERNVELNRSALHTLIEKLLYRLSAKIVVNASSIKRLLEASGIPGDHILTIYNGLDTEHFNDQGRDSPSVQALRTELGIRPDERVFLLPGRIQRQKNHVGLVEALATLSEQLEGVRVLFVGNEFYQDIKAKMIQLAQSAGIADKLVFAGPRANMPTVYSAADVIVLPSLWEGLPNVLIEAMSCRRPVIASVVSDNANFVKPGVNGLLVPTGDSRALASALKECIGANPERLVELGENARATAVSLFSQQRLLEQYRTLIDELTAVR